MKQELIVSGKTIEAAVESAVQQLGVSAEDVTYEVLVQPKKGFLGFGEVLAQVKVVYNQDPIDLATDFLRTLLSNMNVEAELSVSDLDDGKLISIMGDSASVLIGHHGETLDQLQYLVNLVANKKENEEDDRDFTKIMVDIEGYRERREQALRALARRMSARVLKYRRNITLEPMSAYERRIIHSEVQGISGVSTNSIGAERNRRVVIYLEGGKKPIRSTSLPYTDEEE